MKITELLRLVWLNLAQNKFKVILTSFGIVVGAATIMLVIAIGEGGRMEVAAQFQNLNAGAVDIACDTTGSQQTQNAMERIGGMNGTGAGAGRMGGAPGGSGGGFPGMGGSFPNPPDGSGLRSGQEAVSLTEDDMEEILDFVPGLSDATISFSVKSEVEGGSLEESVSYTIAGVKSNYGQLCNLTTAIGDFISGTDCERKEKVCVLGNHAAKEIFGGIQEAFDNTVYIDGRPYSVGGVLEEMGTVASGVSPDEAVYIPYETGIKYLTGTEVSPVITVIAEEISQTGILKSNLETVLADIYPNASFEITDAGSKMEAAEKSNETLTLLLASMAVIVFIVGGIGIMNVLFVSVKERTGEIGILKAIGCSRRDILLEFLLEAGVMSLAGSLLGVLAAVFVTPVIQQFSVRVELSVAGAVLSLVFGVAAGSLFGFYPAYKASRLMPAAALNQE